MKKVVLFLILILNFLGCKSYSFKNYDIGDAKTVQIDFFKNEASIIEPSLSQKFTESFQSLFTNQTNLELVNSKGHLHFSGEITDYRVTPISGTSNQRAAQNRLNVTINVIFENTLNNEKNFNKTFSFYSDFDANSQLSGLILENTISQINERISQDIFNLALANDF